MRSTNDGFGEQGEGEICRLDTAYFKFLFFLEEVYHQQAHIKLSFLRIR